MTKEEHIARAMLLGMKYNQWGGYYVALSEIRRGGTVFARLDAMTLEPIGIEEANERQKSQKVYYPHD
jgi:hypothetical protein